MAFLDWLSVGALGLSAVFAFLAAVRIRALNQVANDHRLARLSSFFYALLVAFAADVLGAVLVLAQEPTGLRDGFGVLDLLYWTRHAGWLAAAGFAFLALTGNKRVNEDTTAPVMAAWLLLAEPILLIIEGLAFLVLMARGAWNHVKRTNLGSLEVAAGFAFLAAGRLLPFLFAGDGPPPLGAPHLAVALVLAGGMWLLMMVVPGARRGGRPGG